jgi:diguanylate cyclase (GGDEF)-like protein
MPNLQKIISVVFDKNMDMILRSDPVFDILFPNIKTLTSFNTFLAKNEALDKNFLAKLNIGGKEHHVCYKCIDLEEIFEFQFFLLDDDWMIINPTGRHDIRDQLTDVLTQRSLLSLLEHEIQSSTRHQEEHTAVIIDIAHLKDINEAFGYLAGDSIIKTLAQTLKTNSRGSDVLGRYQGDKFIIMLTKTDINGTMEFIKKFEAALAKISFTFSDMSFFVKTNYGIISITPKETLKSLLDRLHDKLHEAKEGNISHIEYFT